MAVTTPFEFLRAGRNCWRIERAARAAVLTNGNYFRVLAAALKAARRHVFVVAWDLDARIRLDPRASGAESRSLHAFLRDLLIERPDLTIRCLVWRRPTTYNGNRNARRWFARLRRECPRFDVRYVPAPLGACHHHKLVTIDGTLAFAGGIDPCADRWDRREHRAFDPARRTPDGDHYGPVRDIQMLIDGSAADALDDLARERWRRATGETVAPAPIRVPAAWPSPVPPDFVDVPVAIARTDAHDESAVVREVEALTRDALLGARRSIYIEAQYLTSAMVGALLEQRLRDWAGPEIVVIVTRQSKGVIEQLTMGTNRDRLLRRLRAADHHDRLRVYYACADASCDVEIKIHSKLIVVDDRFLRIGSSNLNNRSMGVDSECDLAIEATDEATRTRIRAIRARLLAELLQQPRDAVEAALDGDSLIGALEGLNAMQRLRPITAMFEPGSTTPMALTPLLDPEQPLSARYLWRALLDPVRQPAGASRVAPPLR
jgi:phosphatidylserine/phosphatidylglycerophosphate/cardiolipin synthase-like enzyme